MHLKKLLLSLLVIAPAISFSNIIFVNQVADDNSPGHLRHAIKTEAVDGDTILIDVKGNLVLDSSITFPVINNLFIIGPYPKHFTIEPAATFTGPSMFLIQIIDGIGISRMAFKNGGTPAIIVNNSINFKVNNCLFESISTTDDGAAIKGGDSDVDVLSCSFISNQGTDGGAVSLNSGNSRIVNSSFIRNNASNNGGAIYVTNTRALDLIHNTFSKNNAIGGVGEVICTANVSSIQLQNNVFSPNGDGINDTWELDGIEAFPNNIVYIYNRWGGRVRKIGNYDNVDVVRDGTNNQNEILPSGTYYYVVEVYGNNSQSGWIQIIK